MTPNFTYKELECHCGCGLLPAPALSWKLQGTRNKLGLPIVLSCAARCLKHNRDVGSRDTSMHPQLFAADVVKIGTRDARRSPVDAEWIASLMRSNGWYCYVEIDHVHCDMRTWFPEILALRKEYGDYEKGNR